MKKKHLLFSALVAVGLQVVQAQEFPSEQRLQEIKEKIALHEDTPLPIQRILEEDEFKDYMMVMQLNDQSIQNTNRGEGESLWMIEAFGSEFVTTPKVGPYDFTVEGTNGSSIFADDINGDGVLYGVDYDTNQFLQIFNDGITEPVVTLDMPVGQSVTGLSWNSTDDTYYVLASDGIDSFIYTFDMESGDITPAFTVPGSLGIWLEFDNNNVAFVGDISNDLLFSYDLGSDTLTEVGALGYNLNYAQDADFDSETGTLYTGLYYLDENNNGFAAIGSVDTTSGQITLLSSPVESKEYLTVSIADELADSPEQPAVGLECGETFADSGGVNGNYSPNEDQTYVIAPENDGDAVTITFTQVDIEASSGNGVQGGCWDYLSIYNGPSVESDVLAETLCGTPTLAPSVPESLLSVGDSFTSTDESGALTVTFKSDGSVNNAGWEADITCAAMAVDEVQLSKFKFYPNPTTGLLQVRAKSNIEGLELYNMLGQKVYQAAPNAVDFNINMDSLKPGTYILRATVDGKVVTNKVMKK